MSSFFAGSGQVESSGSGTIIALNGAVTVSLPASAFAILVVSGTWSATLTLEGSVDGTNYFTIPARNVATQATITTTTTNINIAVSTGGYQSIRLRASSFLSGTATVTWNTDTTANDSLTVLNINGATDGTPIGNSGSSLNTNVTASVLPSGASTAANQATEISSLSSIDTKLTTTNSSLAAIDAGLPVALGQTTMAASMPVVIASNQSTVPVITTNASVIKAQVQDNAGNAISSINSQLLDADFLNTSSQFRNQNSTTSASEALGAGTILANRKFISITPTNGTIFWGTSNAVTTSTGTPIFKNQSFTAAFGPSVHVWIISGSTIDCRIVEAS